MNEGIKPCPFCGCEVVHDNGDGSYNNDISCGECGTFFRMDDTWWNTRPIEDGKDAEIARLRGREEQAAYIIGELIQFGGLPVKLLERADTWLAEHAPAPQ